MNLICLKGPSFRRRMRQARKRGTCNPDVLKFGELLYALHLSKLEAETERNALCAANPEYLIDWHYSAGYAVFLVLKRKASAPMVKVLKLA